MESPRFDFAPHEWPPSAVSSRRRFADAVFQEKWNGEEKEWMARKIDLMDNGTFPHSLLFFRESETKTPTWVVSEVARSGLRSPHYFQIKRKTSLDVSREVRNAIATGNYGRVIRVGVPNVIALRDVYVDGSENRGVWPGFRRFPQRPEELAPFELALNETVEVAIANPSSDVRFALNWLKLSRNEQLRRVLRFRTGGVDEVKQVLRAIGLAEVWLPEMNERTVLFRVGPKVSFSRSTNSLPDEPTRERIQLWADHLYRYFQPHIDAELSASHPCVTHFKYLPYASVSVQPPSQHERLEAALFLRDWAQGIIPPGELALLLPKL